VSTGLVPTMGALHAGHVALLRAARAECERVVMTIFVNPLQFGAGEDFERYPRDEDRDRDLARREGVDEVLAPSVADMYPAGFQTHVCVGDVAARFEGEARPGHFAGVATVVVKLLGRVRPDRLYLGQKDAQQLAVLRRVVRDLDLPVAVRAVPTVRDPDGLACSSRNAYLGADERRRAASLHRALLARDPALVEGELEYLAVVDPDSFCPVEEAPGAIVIGAARFGATRLIDNVPWEGR
jgi:pantoate--beta-alanine ligase